MATMNLTFNCGCGFKSMNASSADDHAETTGHKMECIGTVIPVAQKVKQSKSVFRKPSPDYVAPKGWERGER